MDRRAFVIGTIAAGTTYRLFRTQQSLEHTPLPENAVAMAQRKLWTKGHERGPEYAPAWNCLAYFFRDTESAQAVFERVSDTFLEDLTVDGSKPAVSTPEVQTEDYRQTELLKTHNSVHYDFIAVQRERLFHVWIIVVRENLQLNMEHGIARRKASSELIENQEDDRPYYGKEELFGMLPDISELPSYLELEHFPEEDLYMQDY